MILPTAPSRITRHSLHVTTAGTYDGSLLKTTTWAGTVAGTVSRNYDVNFRITSQSVNGANTITFGYDTDSLLTSAGAQTITRSAQNGLISGTTLGVATDSRTYNTFGEMATSTANVSGSPVLSVTYTRDKLGRITQKVETIGGATDTFDYIYDLAGRLQEVKKNGGTFATYAYDSNGNRLSRTDSFGPITGTYDAQDRQLIYGNLAFTYTTNGELLTKTISGQTTSYTYDVLGNLKSVTLPDSTLIEYVIDGRNRRIGKRLNGTLVQGFLYENPIRVVAELDGTGGVSSRFIYGTRGNAPDYLIKSGVTYRIISDHLGSPRLIVNVADGSVAQRIDYDEFGNITQDTNPGFQPFGFAGGLYDQQTALTRFGARDYDAVTGRWAAKDPIRFGGSGLDAGLYNYVEGDPINWIDPIGLMKIKGAGKDPIYVHPNDPDPRPSVPHGHIGDPNSSTKVDPYTGKIYQGTSDTGKKLKPKQLKVLQDALKKAGLLGVCLVLPFAIDDILGGGDGFGGVVDPGDYIDPFGAIKGTLSDQDMFPLPQR